MENANPPAPDMPNPLRHWGFYALVTGGLAMILVFVHISGILHPPAPSVGEQIGEIAGDIKRSAWRSFFGVENPAPVPVPLAPTRYIEMAIPALGVLAIILAVVSGVLRENWRYVAYGSGLGIAAILFFYVWWIAILFIGAMLLVAIIENIGDIFSF